MGLSVHVLQKQRPLTWEVRVREIPSQENSIVAVFRYRRRGRTVALTEISLCGVDGAPLSAADIQQRHPLVSWEKAARIGVLDLWRESRGEVVPWTRFGADSPDEEREVERLNRYAMVAAEYRNNVRNGLRNPVAEIARKYGVKPGTARGWVYRARKLGLLGDARDRSSGEAMELAPIDRGAGRRRATAPPDAR